MSRRSRTGQPHSFQAFLVGGVPRAGDPPPHLWATRYAPCPTSATGPHMRCRGVCVCVCVCVCAGGGGGGQSFVLGGGGWNRNFQKFVYQE